MPRSAVSQRLVHWSEELKARVLTPWLTSETSFTVSVRPPTTLTLTFGPFCNHPRICLLYCPGPLVLAVTDSDCQQATGERFSDILYPFFLTT